MAIFTLLMDLQKTQNLQLGLTQIPSRTERSNTAMMLKGSKGQTLLKVKDKVSLFKVPDLFIFKSALFKSDPDAVLKKIVVRFGGKVVVVRSSASNEDGAENALAGEYDSVLNVLSSDLDALRNAITVVIASYEKNGRQDKRDEVFVQEMVYDVSMSGVVFTHDLNTGAPYYVINYDDVSGLTNTVTSGDGEYANRTLFIYREALGSLRSDRFQRLMMAVRELERAVNSQFLDIEFALTSDFSPYLLQVRAITTQPNWNRGMARRVDAALSGIQSFVKERLQPMAGVYGQTTVLGQMPDWNPAEMIGRAPRALAFSLYKTLITDHAWRIARDTMGYAVPNGRPLMVSLAGQPFIDTRLSFHSYLPATLPAGIAQKLVDAWIHSLSEHPELHDKVEFDVAITAYSFDLDQRLDLLVGLTLDEKERLEFKQALQQQTRVLLNPMHEGSVAKALSKVDVLASYQRNNGDLCASSDLGALHGMLDDCIHFGTIPFSILARHGFIAKTFLISLYRRGLLTADDLQAIQSEIRTVAGELVDDMRRLQLGALSREHFMAKYGHLRPGTYDILSRRYDQMADLCTNETPIRQERATQSATLSDEQRRGIDAVLKAEGFPELDADKLMAYVQESIAGREYGKFVFTRTLSDILELIANYGEQHGLGRDEMSHISIQHLLDVDARSAEGSVEERLRTIAESGAEQHALSVAIRLPQVLFDEAGVHVVPFQVSHPNFITHKKVTAPVVFLSVGGEIPSLAAKIILIENADPGFDWIFSQHIGGLITKYGGANSHMAIRCAEFGIPAAIGCGEQRFEAFLKANQLSLDCAAGLIISLH